MLEKLCHAVGRSFSSSGTLPIPVRFLAREETHVTEPMAPGDDAAEGTPGTGENICPVCNGSGTVDARACSSCDGTGLIVEGIGGG